MKIIYRQEQERSVLTQYGIFNCYFRALSFRTDATMTTDKSHLHTEFEIHLLTGGHQIYAFDGKEFTLEAGNCLIIPPNVLHRVVYSAEQTEKYSLTFRCDLKAGKLQLPPLQEYLLSPTPTVIGDSIDFIVRESKHANATSPILIEHRILETVILFLRMLGAQEEKIKASRPIAPTILSIARQYIQDNICSALTVQDVASYCHISDKQLSRIFQKHEGISVFDAIRIQRTEHIKLLLADMSLSLREISTQMQFSSEYYLNVFFKKNCGIPPGVYRKHLCKK